MAIFEVYDSNPPDLIALKQKTRPNLERGVALYVAKNFTEAREFFAKVQEINPQDKAIKFYLEKCQ